MIRIFLSLDVFGEENCDKTIQKPLRSLLYEFVMYTRRLLRCEILCVKCFRPHIIATQFGNRARHPRAVEVPFLAIRWIQLQLVAV